MSPTASPGAERLCGRRNSDVMLEPAQGEAAPAGVATIEAEGEFIEIGIQMLRGHRSLVGSEEPAFEERSHLVHPGHGNVGWISAFGDAGWVVSVPLTG